MRCHSTYRALTDRRVVRLPRVTNVASIQRYWRKNVILSFTDPETLQRNIYQTNFDIYALLYKKEKEVSNELLLSFPVEG